ncbi:MAG: hypothetical protein JO112_01025, partial [Planctomycetes bacterium]|nr:hypothetical protein [Planctomycetota bacterium]
MTHCIPAVSRAVTLSTLGALLLLTATSPALAQSKARLAQEAADYLIERFGREAAKDGTEALARRIEA